MTGENNASFILAYSAPTLTASFFSAFPALRCPFGVCGLWAYFSQLKYIPSNTNCSQSTVHPIVCACVGGALGEYFKNWNTHFYGKRNKIRETIEAGWQPGCLCFRFWVLLTWVVDKVTALIFKQLEVQFDPSVIIKMQALEIHRSFSNLLSLTQLPQALSSR